MPTAPEAAEKFRASLIAQERAAAVRLVNAYGRVYQRLQANIEALDAELAALPDDAKRLRYLREKSSRLQALKRQIVAEMERYGAVVEAEVDAGARAAITAAQKDAKTLTQLSLPGLTPVDARIMATWQSLNPEAVESLMGFLADDSPLRVGLREQLGPALADQVADKLIEGIALGYNPRKTARIMEQELGQGLDWTLRTARTAQLWAYREGTRAAYLANPDIVRGWEWLATKDERTCMSCIAMDGTIHKPTERLNDHHNGRCAMLPVVVDYADLGLPVPGRSMERRQTAAQWFEEQDETMQRGMMGEARWEAWKGGKFKLAEIVGTYDDKTYGQMRVERSLIDILGKQVA